MEDSLDMKRSKVYHDEPYAYQSKLLQVLFITSIGKDGMYFNESKLRGLFKLPYFMELLMRPDNYTEPRHSPNDGLEMDVNVI